MPTEERIAKVAKVLSFRQPDLRIVLEEVTNSHNASAVIRTCDAAGVLNVEIISSSQEDLRINEAISTRAEKWIHFHYYSSPRECLLHLKNGGLKIAATHLGEDSIHFKRVDYTQPIAIVFGNESEGISNEVLELADFKIKIPMIGMVQSLNLSVSVGIILYEAMNQRWAKGFYEKRRLSSKEFNSYLNKWLKLNSESKTEIE